MSNAPATLWRPKPTFKMDDAKRWLPYAVIRATDFYIWVESAHRSQPSRLSRAELSAKGRAYTHATGWLFTDAGRKAYDACFAAKDIGEYDAVYAGARVS